MLENKYVVALGVPFVFFVCGGFGHKVVRGGAEFWNRRDWFLGADACLANMATALSYIFEVLFALQKKQTDLRSAMSHLIADGTCLALGMLLYIILLGMHQHYEKPRASPRGQLYGLVLFSNLIALAQMFGFVIYLKGV
ncbi:hypothetical protein [Burkholderia thailandensis]|uniref:hypothetical protein n=1 Tax=Burkholderia thailandensis TaxID=57975 RepID=UPI0022ABF3B2|nr:hypothetical protein [Burkholderia thailandensis]MCZ2903323.1 hypothetical protein [Burkholderia thailandensis]MDD1484316.1 hypothetical protein [Burkholderia thailandensis]MDD1490296.1 hypothetical protein [Burkholderia thailandensis]MDD1496514.1 hypothetical protein [Burkholderia thailandensis]